MVIDEIAEQLRSRATEALLVLTEGEIKSWEMHPCTVALVKYIQYEYLSKHVQWSSGSFTHETADGSEQLNAQAIGEVTAFEVVETYIKDMQQLVKEAVEEQQYD